MVTFRKVSDLSHRHWPTAIRSPVLWLLLAGAVLRLPGLMWGLPASDGWDSDGVAPRDFLIGVVKTYRTGDFFTYPPLHLLLLTALTAPGWIVGLIKASSFAQSDLISEFIKPPYMTFFAVTARLVSIALSLATIVFASKIGQEIGGRRVGLLVVAICVLNPVLTYYGQTSNLDAPYLFWAMAAMWQWTRVISRHEIGRVRWALLFTVAAIATKDQAYAIFILSIPLVLALWFLADAAARENSREILFNLLVWSTISLLLLLAVDGALTNPIGFGLRFAFLIGSASQDHAYYARDWHGRIRLLRDIWDDFAKYYPSVIAYISLLGFMTHCSRANADRGVWVAGFLPLLAIISFTATFNFVALRAESRFVLPQLLFLSIYAALGVDFLLGLKPAIVRWAVRISVSIVAGLAIHQCLAVSAALRNDPRYDAERWLKDNVAADDHIETYGLNVYLPRFSAGRVSRVSPLPIENRSPLPGVTEIQQPLDAIEIRSPRFIVISEAWANRYLAPDASDNSDSRLLSNDQRRQFQETATRRYFHDLYEQRLRYRLAHSSTYESPFWPRVHLHESLAETVRIFQRVE